MPQNKNNPSVSSKESSVPDTSTEKDAVAAAEYSENNSSSNERPKHDSLIRKALENPIVAKEFFEMHLPKEIKAMFSPHTLKMEKESFVEASLKKALSK